MPAPSRSSPASGSKSAPAVPKVIFGSDPSNPLSSKLTRIEITSPNLILLRGLISHWFKFKFDELYYKYGKKVKVIGNIPYNITSAIIFKLIENNNYISRIVLMVQKEVANRILAKSNCKDYGIFSIMIQSKADVKLLFNVKRKDFYPPRQLKA